MNNRVRELEQQAWEEAGMVVSLEYIDDFANRILQECISLFDGSIEMKTVGMLTHKQVIDQIKNHFGIEK